MNTRNLRFRSNRVRDILRLFHEELDALYGNGEVAVFLDMLFEGFLGWDKVRLLTSKEQTIDQSDLLRFHWALEDLKQHRPIQHIVGYTDFCGCKIKVTPDVLIPRPETEEIVNWIISNFNVQRSTFNSLDLCTGSGCIAIALKKAFPEAEVTAVDLSPAALAVARQNAEENGTAITFLQADLLTSTLNFPACFAGLEHRRIKNNSSEKLSTFNLIVSNPPYVRDSERAQMSHNVLDYEPSLALFVPDDDPLRFYRAIAALARKFLAPDGRLVLEINEALADETCRLLGLQGFTATVYTDFRGRKRMIGAQFS